MPKRAFSHTLDRQWGSADIIEATNQDHVSVYSPIGQCAVSHDDGTDRRSESQRRHRNDMAQKAQLKDRDAFVSNAPRSSTELVDAWRREKAANKTLLAENEKLKAENTHLLGQCTALAKSSKDNFREGVFMGRRKLDHMVASPAPAKRSRRL